MSIKIERLPGESILSFVFEGRFATEDLRYVERESTSLAADLDKPIFRISDARAMQVSFSDLVVLMFDAANAGNTPGSLADPDFIDLIIVKPEGLVAFGARSLNQEHYGTFNIHVFESPDEAFAHARTEIARRAT